MIGAIIGDIVGSRFEFHNTTSKRFLLFGADCNFTDDTVCSVAVADAILSQRDYGETLRDWCSRYPMCAYGDSFTSWLLSSEPKPYLSFGNGAAMRVSAVGWLFDNLQDVQREAMNSASCSHNHPEGLIGAMVVASAIFMLRTNPSDIASVETLVRQFYGEHFEQTLPRVGVFDVTCQGCVPLAFHLLLGSISFEDAIRNAIAYGGDSDTLAAIVGSLAEARWGVPAKIRTEALGYMPDDMLSVINEFEKCKTI